MFDLVEDSVRLTLINHEAITSSPVQNESEKSTDLMSVSEEASKATACISVSKAACLRKKTVCTVKGKVTKVDAHDLF